MHTELPGRVKLQALQTTEDLTVPAAPDAAPAKPPDTPLVQRIKRRMKALNLDVKSVGRAAGKSAALIENLLYGKSRTLNLTTAVAVAQVLQVSVDWLATGRAAPESLVATDDDSLWIELKGTALGTIYEGARGFHYSQAKPARVPRPNGLAGRPDAELLKVSGNSMAPRYVDGEIIAIDRGASETLKPLDFVVIETRNFPEAPAQLWLKQLVKAGSDWIQVSQLENNVSLRFPAKYVKGIYPVLTTAEILGL